MFDIISNRGPEVHTEPGIICVAGAVSTTTLDLVQPGLTVQQEDNLVWYHLKARYEGVTVGDEFTQWFIVTYHGIVVPITESRCVIRAIQMEPGNFYDLEFYRQNIAFKKVWGWRPLVLIEFEGGRPGIFSWHSPQDRWQLGNWFLLATPEAYQRCLNAEPRMGVVGVQDFLEALQGMARVREQVRNTLSFQPVASFEDVIRNMDARWKLDLLEEAPEEWQQCLLGLGDEFELSEAQLARLIYLLEQVWGDGMSHRWSLKVDTVDGGFYGLGHHDLIFVVDGAMYWLHMSWSD